MTLSPLFNELPVGIEWADPLSANVDDADSAIVELAASEPAKGFAERLPMEWYQQMALATGRIEPSAADVEGSDRQWEMPIGRPDDTESGTPGEGDLITAVGMLVTPPNVGAPSELPLRLNDSVGIDVESPDRNQVVVTEGDRAAPQLQQLRGMTRTARSLQPESDAGPRSVPLTAALSLARQPVAGGQSFEGEGDINNLNDLLTGLTESRRSKGPIETGDQSQSLSSRNTASTSSEPAGADKPDEAFSSRGIVAASVLRRAVVGGVPDSISGSAAVTGVVLTANRTDLGRAAADTEASPDAEARSAVAGPAMPGVEPARSRPDDQSPRNVSPPGVRRTTTEASSHGLDANINRLVETAFDRLQGVSHRSEDEFEVQLTPPELGTLRVTIRRTGNGVEVSLAASDPRTQALFEAVRSDIASELQQWGAERNSVQLGTQADRSPDDSQGLSARETPDSIRLPRRTPRPPPLVFPIAGYLA